jgi:hypothetical protein
LKNPKTLKNNLNPTNLKTVQKKSPKPSESNNPTNPKPCKKNTTLHTLPPQAAEVSHLTSEHARERSQFDHKWAAWERGAKQAAIAKGLPRNWLPQADPITNQIYYLNTRDATMHRYHPNVKPVMAYALKVYNHK